MNATITQTETIQLYAVARVEGELCATASNPTNDYEGYEAAPNMIEFDGVTMGKTGWNSDTGTLSYSESGARPFANVIG